MSLTLTCGALLRELDNRPALGADSDGPADWIGQVEVTGRAVAVAIAVVADANEDRRRAALEPRSGLELARTRQIDQSEGMGGEHRCEIVVGQTRESFNPVLWFLGDGRWFDRISLRRNDMWTQLASLEGHHRGWTKLDDLSHSREYMYKCVRGRRCAAGRREALEIQDICLTAQAATRNKAFSGCCSSSL